MAATSINNSDQIQIDQTQSILTNSKLFIITSDEDETDLDGTTEIENAEKESPYKPSEISVPIRQWSGLSMTSLSITNKKSKSNSYKFVQLERALTSAKLLKKNDDRIQFENEYLRSLNENRFDEFLNNYYQKIYDHYQRIKQEQEFKKTRAFTFVDLEKNFFTLDPTRDIKIVFVDEPITSTITKTATTRSAASARQRSTSSAISNDAAIELFYANRSRRLLCDPAYAREEISLFARRAAERLHERLPRMSSVPHRVKIVDERDTTGKPDERTLLQMKHKRALSLINKRRHIIIKMMTQSKKNEIKMEQQWKQTPIALDSAACCRELLERANQIDQVYGEKIIRRPQTALVSRRTPSKNISSSASSVTATKSTNITPSFSSRSTPFHDALSIEHVGKTKDVRVILPTRPLTAPVKVNWVNYC
ncbi:unnamed protein product [Rotaria sordida]|uniref:Uncharacterized protein n=1 Tax=Rotaria sordida TaxID=392033 RepID=A0A818Z617_9BILA|nr:unnamed protein product [Rotaria sordida]CAF3766396.1 unnamed protein product [Rotaria sordida]